MLENLHLLAYNNYYNRQVKRESAYLSYQEYEMFTNNSVNFNPNDHINTVVKVTLNNVSLSTPSYSVEDAIEQINYLVVTDTTNSIINSRWFIIDAKREGTTSWHVSLRRDVVADNYHTILDAPVFIEKGTPSVGNPLLFNRENMGYNQIKQGEWLLKDKTRCPWLVGYYSKKIDEGSDNALTGTVQQDNGNFINLPVQTINNWKYYKYNSVDGTDLFYSPPTNKIFTFNFNVPHTGRGQSITVNQNNRTTIGGVIPDLIYGNSMNPTGTNTYIEDIGNAFLNTYFYGWTDALIAEGAFGSHADYDDLMSYDNKLVQTMDGKVYDISVRRATPTQKTTNISPVGALAKDYIAPVLSQFSYITVTPNENSYSITAELLSYQVYLTERSGVETTYDISGGRKCEDEVYNLFAIPYGEVTLQGVETTTINNPALALDLARSIQRNGGSNIYDIQLLPFCPCRDLIQEDGSIILSEGAYSMVGDQMVVFYPLFANFSIPELIIEGTVDGMDWSAVPKYGGVEEQKIIAECDEIRLVSPNYNGQFSFNIARNNGIPGFTADCTYKPYTPYIHVNPVFGGLYGQDFNDARGLICQGDFSISAITDAWTQYEINNKNYNNIFNREIQNMEKNNNIQAHLDVAHALSGVVSGAASGGAIGAMAGGPTGAVAGAIGGGVASLLGGAADITFNAILRNEQLDLKRDMYGYQLGNIQALPYSLSKVSALNENNKLFPFVEYYTCTEKEKQALRNKLKYNGYTIMAIDNIPNYSPVNVETYIKGRVIRFDDQIESHTAYAINDELQSGIFIKRNDSEV